jgi:LDH2 family malate/lactate/ureidoglycolate dehydrogenase
MAASIPNIYGFDMTLPSTSENSVHHALMSGNQLSTPLILENGNSTFNPSDLYVQTQHGLNALGSKTAIPFDSHKLFNLAILSELLAGILTDSGTSARNQFHSGCFGLMIKLTDTTKEYIRAYVNWIKTSEGVRLPGDKYQENIQLLDWENDILNHFSGE